MLSTPSRVDVVVLASKCRGVILGIDLLYWLMIVHCCSGLCGGDILLPFLVLFQVKIFGLGAIIATIMLRMTTQRHSQILLARVIRVDVLVALGQPVQSSLLSDKIYDTTDYCASMLIRPIEEN